MKSETFSPSLKIFDSSFQGEYTPNYHLSFVLTSRSLSYCILDLKQNHLNALEEIPVSGNDDIRSLCTRLKSLVNESPILSSQFKSTSFGIFGEKSTLVPAGLFEIEHIKDYLQFNFSEGEISAVSDFLPNNELYNVYDAPPLIIQTIKELFNGVKIMHFSSPLIESLSIVNKYKSTLKVYLHFLDKNRHANARFEIIIFEKGKLLFFNSFIYQEKEDIAYFLLFVLDQLNINPENLPVTVLGNVLKSDEALTLLKDYVIVEFGRRPGNFEYSKAFDEVPSHFYYALLCQYLYV